MTITGTPIDNLQFSDGDDPIATGDDLIRAALLLIDGRLHMPGDLKHSVRTADHGLWVVADGRNNIVRANVHPDFVTEMSALGYNGTDGAHIGVPDYRGRVLVGLGQHADVNALTDNEGATVANRTPKHKHHVGTLAAVTAVTGDGSHDHAIHAQALQTSVVGNWPGLLGYDDNGHQFDALKSAGGGGGHGHGADTTLSGEIGTTTGPGETPAYGVGCIFIFTGKP